MAEGTSLLRKHTGKTCIVGSNPTASARTNKKGIPCGMPFLFVRTESVGFEDRAPTRARALRIATLPQLRAASRAISAARPLLLSLRSVVASPAGCHKRMRLRHSKEWLVRTDGRGIRRPRPTRRGLSKSAGEERTLRKLAGVARAAPRQRADARKAAQQHQPT